MLVILINLVATFGLCLYLSNGQLMLFQPGGIKNVLERLKSTVKEEEKEGEDPEMKTVPIKEAFQNFIHNQRMLIRATIFVDGTCLFRCRNVFWRWCSAFVSCPDEEQYGIWRY